MSIQQNTNANLTYSFEQNIVLKFQKHLEKGTKIRTVKSHNCHFSIN